MLKPQDIVIAVKIFSLLKNDPNRNLTYRLLSNQTLISVAEVHAAIKRLVLAALLGLIAKGDKFKFRIINAALYECLLSLRYFIPPVYTGITNGVFTSSPKGTTVWPRSDCDHVGEGLEPIYKTLPYIVGHRDRDGILDDGIFWQMWSRIDSIRCGYKGSPFCDPRQKTDDPREILKMMINNPNYQDWDPWHKMDQVD